MGNVLTRARNDNPVRNDVELVQHENPPAVEVLENNVAQEQDDIEEESSDSSEEERKSTDYDLVIDINNICDGLSLQWPVSISPWLRERASQNPNRELCRVIDQYFKDPPNIVSIMGRFDRGKTFIINQLAETLLPCGSKIQTKGLSFLCPKDNDNSNVIYLDTSGTNSPLRGCKLFRTIYSSNY